MAERVAKTIDDRFDEVTQAFLDQRDFTMFVHDKLRDEIRQSEGRLSDRIDGVKRKVDGLEVKVDSLDRKVGALDGKVGGLEGKVEGMAQAIDRRFTRNELLLTEILNEVKRR
jgi:chromosome segregation ATPase